MTSTAEKDTKMHDYMTAFKFVLGGMAICSFAVTFSGIFGVLWPIVCSLMCKMTSVLLSLTSSSVFFVTHAFHVSARLVIHASLRSLNFCRFVAFIAIGLVEMGCSWVWSRAIGVGIAIQASVEDLAREASMR